MLVQRVKKDGARGCHSHKLNLRRNWKYLAAEQVQKQHDQISFDSLEAICFCLVKLHRFTCLTYHCHLPSLTPHGTVV